jgi:hypothetical protein
MSIFNNIYFLPHSVPKGPKSGLVQGLRDKPRLWGLPLLKFSLPPVGNLFLTALCVKGPFGTCPRPPAGKTEVFSGKLKSRRQAPQGF